MGVNWELIPNFHDVVSEKNTYGHQLKIVVKHVIGMASSTATTQEISNNSGLECPLSTNVLSPTSEAMFLPRCMEFRRGLAMRIMSVRLSVKRVNCGKTEEKSSRFLYHTKDHLA